MFSKKQAPAKTAPAAEKPAPQAMAPAKSGGDVKPKKQGLLPFGKKKTPPPAAAKSAREGAPIPSSLAPAAKAGATPAKGAPAKKKGGSPLTLLLPILLLLAVGGGGYFAYTRLMGKSTPTFGLPQASAPLTLADTPSADAGDAQSTKPKPKATRRATSRPDANTADANTTPAQPVTPAAYPAQSTNVADCAGQPKFIAALGLGGNAYFDTSELHRLVLLAPIANSDAVSKYQNQSWSKAGFVDAFALDRAGNVYLAPSPRTGPGVKAPKAQDVIYKVDTDTGDLSKYITLPGAAAASAENPYGVVGLAYDCDTNSLYATTLTGSTAASEVGRIYRIDLNTNAIAGELDNVDALGVAVGNGANGKQLYFGAARNAKIRAVALDAAGNFQGDARDVASLDAAQRAQRITFASPTEMIVQAVEFNYSSAEIPQGSETRLQHDAASDQWRLAQ